MSKSQHALWSDEDTETLLRLLAEKTPLQDIADQLKRSYGSIRMRIRTIKTNSHDAVISRARQANLNPPIETNDKNRLRELEAENARLKTQLAWQGHSNPENHSGGLLTIRESDAHHGDEQHLLSCYASCEAKVLTLIELHKPDRIQLIAMDDFIAGKGIFKEQDLSMAVSDVEMQMQIGAYKMFRKLSGIRAVTDAPIHVHALRGNHDYLGKTSLGVSLFFMAATACGAIPNVTMQYRGDSATVNLADAGTYNVLAQHGYGHSKISPNSPSFMDGIKDKLLQMQRQMHPHEQIRRVLSGHTHWLSCGVERQLGLYWDTTGGFQKNTRVQLGMNQRPVGVIVYVSPKGHDEILNPIAVKPEDEVQAREIADPSLGAANREDCAKCLTEFQTTMKARGLFAEGESFGQVTEGRW